MAVVGIDRVYLGVFDDKGNVLTDAETGLATTGVIEVTNDMLGTAAVNLQISKSGEEIDGNNSEVGYIKSLPTAQMDVQFNNLPFDIQNKILGRVKSGAGYVDTMANVYCGIIAKSPCMDMKHYVYYCMGKCVATPKGKNMQSNTSKKVNRVVDDISFEGVACDKTDGMPYLVASDMESDFNAATLFSQIFPSQTLITGSGVTSATTGQQGKQ